MCDIAGFADFNKKSSEEIVRQLLVRDLIPYAEGLKIILETFRKGKN